MTAARRSRTLLLLTALVGGAALLRFALAARIPLAHDEAYYWLWSRHLEWGYPDHPPMIAGLIALATRLAGDSPLAIRTLTGVLASAIPLLVYATGRDLIDAPSGLRAALIVSVLPIVAVGTALAFPDAPFGLFWMLSLWTGWRALRDGGWWWVATGAAVGLALLAKLTGFALLLGFAGILATDGWRRVLRDRGFYAGAAVAAVIVAPFIVWNATHDWWTFRFTLDRPPWMQPRSVPENLLFFAAGQLGYHGVAALALVAAMIAVARRPGQHWRYLAWMSVPLFLVILLSAVWAKAKPHWPTPAYFAAAIALGALWPEPRWSRLWTKAAVALTALLTLSILVAVLLRVVDLTASFGRWEGAAQAAERRAIERQKAGFHVFILTDGYQAASQIAYHLRERVDVTPLWNAFSLWLPHHTLLYRDAVYVETDGRWKIREHCEGVTREEAVSVSPQMTATLYVCAKFRDISP